MFSENEETPIDIEKIRQLFASFGKKKPKVYHPRWTPERAEKQRQWMLKNKPWLKSTGAKTPEGKAICSQNGRKTGLYTSYMLQLQKESKKIIKDMNKNLPKKGKIK